MATNVLGVVTAALLTNYLRTDFIPLPCGVCSNSHHCITIEHYEIRQGASAQVMHGDQVKIVEVGPSAFVNTFTRTGMVRRPGEYSAPGVAPLMPPIPLPRRSNTNLVAKP